MCGRYTLIEHEQDLAKRYNLATTPDGLKSNFNVAPGQFMPTVRQTEQGISLELMRWGLVPHWSKDPKIGYRLINARADTIFEKPIWRQSIIKKRCLVPFSGFYEWQKDEKEQKQPYYIKPKADADGIASFAGIWEQYKDVEGKEWHTYSIITTTPNKEMSVVHNRMPVILSQKDESNWLDPGMDNPKDIQQFLKPYQDEGLEIYKVSKDVNSPKHNSKELIYALDE